MKSPRKNDYVYKCISVSLVVHMVEWCHVILSRPPDLRQESRSKCSYRVFSRITATVTAVVVATDVTTGTSTTTTTYYL